VSSGFRLESEAGTRPKSELAKSGVGSRNSPSRKMDIGPGRKLAKSELGRVPISDSEFRVPTWRVPDPDFRLRFPARVYYYQTSIRLRSAKLARGRTGGMRRGYLGYRILVIFPRYRQQAVHGISPQRRDRFPVREMHSSHAPVPTPQGAGRARMRSARESSINGSRSQGFNEHEQGLVFNQFPPTEKIPSRIPVSDTGI